jgi:hypothetical protein
LYVADFFDAEPQKLLRNNTANFNHICWLLYAQSHCPYSFKRRLNLKFPVLVFNFCRSSFYSFTQLKIFFLYLFSCDYLPVIGSCVWKGAVLMYIFQPFSPFAVPLISSF